MIKNYLKIARRNLVKNKMYSLINIMGLAIGIATCILIILYVKDELSYDTFNKNADRIVRVAVKSSLEGEKLNFPTLGPHTAQDIRNDVPEVIQTVRLRTRSATLVSNGDKSFKETHILYADPTIFDVFTFPLIKGSSKTALSEPNSIVVTQETANRYFGEENALGKTLKFKDGLYKVTGLIKEVPSNSHFKFDFLVSMSSLKDSKDPGWLDNTNFYTYLLLSEKSSHKSVEGKLAVIAEKYIEPEIQQFMNLSLDEFRKRGNDFGFFLQPLNTIHLHSSLASELGSNSDIRYVYIISAIGLFMLLIACVNFMNLSTATAHDRAREVGVRRVLGSQKGQLRLQFLVESSLISALAFTLGVLIVKITIPYFNQLSGKSLDLELFSNPLTLPYLVLGILFVGILAGSYPSFYLASFNPIRILKGSMVVGKGSTQLRNGLVVFQFFISITVMSATIITYQQLRFLQNREVGFDKTQVLLINDSNGLLNNEKVFRERTLGLPGVVNSSISANVPTEESVDNKSGMIPKDDQNKLVQMQEYNVDDRYLPVLGIEIVQGRNFSSGVPSDSSAVIINETAVRALGWGKQATDRELLGFVSNGDKKAYRVIGVVKDFHFKSLHQKIAPLVMFYGSNSGSILIKTDNGNIASLITSLKKEWNKFSPGSPFTYSFLDARFNQMYSSEQKISQVLGVSSGLIIFIACLGLLGLAMHTAERRKKEIGIRKVLGSSVSGIVSLLSKDFAKLMTISLLLSIPISIWVMNKWLEDFAYRINIEWWMFGITAIVAIAIALITVSFQAIKAALTNPVNSLRTE